MKIIGFAANAGGGKDTAAALVTSALQEKGYAVTTLSFASCLKDMCTMMFGWDRDRLENDFAYKEGNTLDDGSLDPACGMLGMTRRIVMQKVGTDAMRKGLHQDIWIICMKLAIVRGDYDQYDYGLLSDCRFMNELEFIKDMGGTLIRLNRMGDVTTSTKETDHISENEWKQWTDWDATIINFVDPELSTTYNLLAFRNKLEDAIKYHDIENINLLSYFQYPSWHW